MGGRDASKGFRDWKGNRYNPGEGRTRGRNRGGAMHGILKAEQEKIEQERKNLEKELEKERAKSSGANQKTQQPKGGSVGEAKRPTTAEGKGKKRELSSAAGASTPRSSK